jgi:hypothetical protein
MEAAVQAHRVPVSPDILKAGDYCFIPKKDPMRTYETVLAEPPTGRWKRIIWALFRSKTITKVTELPLWPNYDAVVMACPHCNQPIGTTKDHKIVSVEPLTLDKPLACAYSSAGFRSAATIAFEVKDGKIMPA